METRTGFDFRRRTQLYTNPFSDQFLQILQCSSQELAEYIKAQVESNPLLEIDEDIILKMEGMPLDEEHFPADWWGYLNTMDDNPEDYDNSGLIMEAKGKYPNLGNALHSSTSLYEYLMLQLQVLNLPRPERQIASFIIKHINDNGYLTISKIEIANILKVNRKTVSDCLKIIQSFDPPGVGARSLRECLLIQLKQKGLLTPTVKTIVLNHLRDIASDNYYYISVKQGIPVSKAKYICSIIKSLEPKPGRPFFRSSPVNYIFPDIEVAKWGEQYIVNISDICAPRLNISDTYYSLLNRSDTDHSVRKFINEHLETACSIINLVDHRRIVIKKVVDSIMVHQSDFMKKGPGFLNNISIDVVSEETNLHESIVIKAVKEKHMQTPYGMFDLEAFIK